MSNRNLAEQLKSLKAERAGGSPDASWLASARETILMQISNTVGGETRKTGFAALFEGLSFFSTEVTRVVAVPMAAIVLLLGTHFGAVGVVELAKNTLPGDALYGAKISAEKVSLLFAGSETKSHLELEIAGRRLDEMSRLAASTDFNKEKKLSEVSGRFAATMSGVRADLAELRTNGASDASLRVALNIDQKADIYQAVFAKNGLSDRPNLRLALLSLDQVSVQALEVMVDKQSNGSGALPEAQLSSAVGSKIDTIAMHVAAAPNAPAAAKAEAAVAEAKQLFTSGDFKAAVRKVIEGADFAAQGSVTTSTSATKSATTTLDTGAATNTKLKL